MWRVKEETPNIPHCSVLTRCQSKESFKHHYFRSNVELPLRLKDKKARKQLLNLEKKCHKFKSLCKNDIIYEVIHPNYKTSRDSSVRA